MDFQKETIVNRVCVDQDAEIATLRGQLAVAKARVEKAEKERDILANELSCRFDAVESQRAALDAGAEDDERYSSLIRRLAHERDVNAEALRIAAADIASLKDRLSGAEAALERAQKGVTLTEEEAKFLTTCAYAHGTVMEGLVTRCRASLAARPLVVSGGEVKVRESGMVAIGEFLFSPWFLRIMSSAMLELGKDNYVVMNGLTVFSDRIMTGGKGGSVLATRDELDAVLKEAEGGAK